MEKKGQAALFREQSIKRQLGIRPGSVSLATPVSASYWMLLAAAIIVMVSGFSGFDEFARRVSVQGTLVRSSEESNRTLMNGKLPCVTSGINIQRKDLLSRIVILQNRLKELADELALLQSVASSSSQRETSQLEQQTHEIPSRYDCNVTLSSTSTIVDPSDSDGQTITSSRIPHGEAQKDLRLEAKLLVPRNAIRFIKIGDTFVFRYPAYPYQKFGVQKGEVQHVSLATSGDAEAAFIPADNPQSPYYRVIVSLNKHGMTVQQRAAVLRPGMAVEAEVVLEKSNFWQWAIASLYGVRQQQIAQRTAQ